jgi:hypothetical protein
MEDIFGDISDLTSDTSYSEHPLIPGLFIYENALSESTQHGILEAIRSSDMISIQCNQAMRFGTLPTFLDPIIHLATKLLPQNLISQRGDSNILFDQLILNHYFPGQGITDVC